MISVQGPLNVEQAREPVCPDVSVFMPVYNSERFLRPAVESVLAQTHRNFEFLIVDDCSTDTSPAILQDYAARDARIVLLRQPQNKGIAASLNRALGAARAALVAKMDADDRMLPNRIERQLEFMRAHPEVTVGSSYYYMIDVFGKRIGQSGIGYADGRIDENGGNPLNAVWIHSTTVILRKTEILKLGGASIQFMHGTEDRDLWGRVLTSGGTIRCQPEFLTEYRLHAGALTGTHARHNLMVYWFTEENIKRRMAGQPELSRDEFGQWARKRPFLQRVAGSRKMLSFSYYNLATRQYGERRYLRFLFLMGVSVALRPLVTVRRILHRIWPRSVRGAAVSAARHSTGPSGSLPL